MNSLATSCCHILEMTTRTSKCIERRRKVPFFEKAMVFLVVSCLYVLVRSYCCFWCLWWSNLYRCWRSKPLVYILQTNKQKKNTYKEVSVCFMALCVSLSLPITRMVRYWRLRHFENRKTLKSLFFLKRNKSFGFKSRAPPCSHILEMAMRK